MRRMSFAGIVAATMVSGAAAWAMASGSMSADTRASTDAVQVVSGGNEIASNAAPAGWPVAGGSGVAPSTPAGSDFVFGVQTHFSQGWGASVLDAVSRLDVHNLRDTVAWAAAERSRGFYDFSSPAVATLDRFCRQGGKLTLTIVPKNPLYDGGVTVYSTAGQAGYAAYLAALATRFGSCLSALEVGNEVNGAGTLNYPAGYDRAATYVSTLRMLYPRVKAAAPHVAILGGSTNAIGTGFLATLFAAGMLNAVDGIAVHPYRSTAEGIDLEIARLRTVMAGYGTPKPIWATEYSFGLSDQSEQASALIKSAIQLRASGVRQANWYAVLEQKHFPYMGLVDQAGEKLAAQALRTLKTRLLPYGVPQEIDSQGRPIKLYRLGADRWIVWGDEVTMDFGPSATVRNMLGTVVGSGGHVRVSDAPLIVEGTTQFSFGEDPVIGDSLYQFGGADWSYFRRDRNGVETKLGWFDTDFTSHFGDRWSKPLRINIDSAATAGDARSPMRAVVRYTAPRTMSVDVGLCLSKTVSGDGVDYLVEKNGQKLAAGVLVSRATLSGLKMNLARGDRLDVSFGPNQVAGGDALRYRIVIGRHDRNGAAICTATMS